MACTTWRSVGLSHCRCGSIGAGHGKGSLHVTVQQPRSLHALSKDRGPLQDQITGGLLKDPEATQCADDDDDGDADTVTPAAMQCLCSILDLSQQQRCLPEVLASLPEPEGELSTEAFAVRSAPC